MASNLVSIDPAAEYTTLVLSGLRIRVSHLQNVQALRLAFNSSVTSMESRETATCYECIASISLLYPQLIPNALLLHRHRRNTRLSSLCHLPLLQMCGGRQARSIGARSWVCNK